MECSSDGTFTIKSDRMSISSSDILFPSSAFPTAASVLLPEPHSINSWLLMASGDDALYTKTVFFCGVTLQSITTSPERP